MRTRKIGKWETESLGAPDRRDMRERACLGRLLLGALSRTGFPPISHSSSLWVSLKDVNIASWLVENCGCSCACVVG